MKRVFTFLISIITVLGFSLSTANAQTYCASAAVYTYDSMIDYVGLTGNTTSISNTSTGTCAVYTDYTALPAANLSPGSTYTVDVTAGTCGGNYTKGASVFIDWNQDFDFDDPGENIGYTASSSATVTYNITFTVPFTASLGTTRMRVIVAETSSTSSIQACTSSYNYYYGEAEDYSLSIMPVSDIDAGVSEIITPTPNENEAASVPVEVVIMNYGNNVMVAATVAYSVDGGTPVTYNWLGLLNNAESDTVILPNLTIPPGSHDLCAWTELTGDTIPQDDTTCMSFYGLPLWDAGVTAILSPGALELENNVVAPEVTVENFGVNTITTMDIVYTINGGTTTTFAWTGSLAPLATANVTLPTFVVPGGNDEICAWTVVALDGDANNDTTCFAFYADPQFDFAAEAFLSPIPYCGMGLEDVIAQFINLGDTVYTFDMGYSANGGTAVIETVTQTVYPGDTLTYTFLTQIDMTTTLFDVLYSFEVWSSVLGDPLLNNDTIYADVISFHIPESPIAQNVTVVYGNAADLIAFSIDTVLWFESDTVGAPDVATGNYFTTPILLDTAYYWVQATGPSSGALAITEVSQGSPDYIEITNLSSSNFDATGWKVATSNSYTVINTINTTFWQLGNFTANEVQYKTDASSNNYWGSNLFYSAGQTGWVMLIDDNDEIVDFVAWGWTLAAIQGMAPVIAGVTMTIGDQWLSDAVPSAANVLERIEFDNDIAADWQNLAVGNMGTLNPALVGVQAGAGCASALVPVIVYVTDIPTQDVGVVGLVAPIDGVELSTTETVTVEVYNYGLQQIWNIPVSFSVNGVVIATETIPDTIQPYGTFIHTFTATADLSAIQTHQIEACTSHALDIYSFNDCMTFPVICYPLIYCDSWANNVTYQQIVNVTLSNINNTTTPNSTSGYSDFSSLSPAVLSIGGTYDISVSSDYSGSTYLYNSWVEVYIDWNHDGIYDETTDELVLSVASSSLNTVVGTINVPFGASSGVHGMRVVLDMLSNAAGVTPCGSYSYGETEDYIVNVLPMITQDGGVTGFITPGAFAVENFPEPVEVTVLNYGSDTLFAFDVAYVLNGGTPVITSWTGVLAPTMSTNIVLPDIIPIGLTNNICAYTIVTGDSNTSNDEWCTSFYATPQYEAGVTAIFPESGCGLGMEDVILRIQNYGDTIVGNMLATYIFNGGAPITGVVLDQILPGDSLDFVFATQQDFTVTTANDTFYLQGFINLLNDPIQTNDSIFSEVISMFTPDPPTVTNDTVQYGDTAVLYANASAGLYWYDDPLGSASGAQYMVNDTFIVTPILYDTLTYYVEASGASSGTFQVGTGTNVTSTTGYPNPYCTYYYGNREQFLYTAAELTALGMVGGPINSVQFNLISAPANSLSNFTVYVGQTSATVMSGWISGLTQVWLDPSYQASAGWNEHVFSTPFIWDGSSSLIIETCFNNTSWTSGGQIEYTTTPFNSAKVYRADNTSVCSSTSQSYLNGNRPNTIFNASVPGCGSNPIGVTAIVQGIPLYDAGITAMLSPVSGIELTACEDVTVIIQNWGVNSIANFPVYYSINGGAPVMEIVQFSLNSGDSYTHTFSTCADLYTFASYDFCAWTGVLGDTYTANDSTCMTIVNDPLIYCDSYATSAAYEDVIDVTIGTWGNYSGPAVGSTYSDFTSIPGPFLAVGNTYTISVTTGLPPGYTYPYTCYVEVYIDYNHDGVYSEPDEIAFGASTNSSNTVTGTFMVPFGAISATTGMRVVMEETSSAGNVFPCGTYTWGETEDYLCMIAPQIPNDAGVTEILQPFNNLVENSISPVEVTVQNFGTDTIYNMNVNYEIDGGPPVTYAFVGPLAPASSILVALPDLVVPGGFYDICAYTILAGDSNTFNDETCDNLFATPQFEAEMNAITSPEEGCDLGFQDVVVTVVNLGDTIAVGNLDLSYAHASITTVTETYPDTIFPLDTVSYTFNQQVDLTVTASMDFEIFAWLDLVGDPIQTNDTTVTIVWSGLTPPDPTANDITIWSGEFGIIDVTNLDSTLIYNWYYAADTSLISNDFSLTTPILFDTTEFFVEAVTGVAATAFSTPFNSNNGQSGNMFDLTSLTGNITIESFDVNIDNSVEVEVYYKQGSYSGFETNASAWTLLGATYVTSNGLNNPSPCAIGGLTIPAGDTYAIYITVTTGTGMNYTTLSAPPNWTDGNLLIDNSCGKSYPFGSTFTPRGWNGTIYYGSGACGSALVPVTANVQYADYDAAVWNVTSPAFGSFLGMETVTAEVYNNGIFPIADFPISFTVDGGTVVVDTFPGTLSPGVMQLFTFTEQANLAAFDTFNICVFTGLVNDGLTNNDTTCVEVINVEGDGLACVTAFPYLYVNDPAVYGATTFAYDAEWWRFELIGNYINVSVSLCSSGYDTKLEVYDDCNSSYIGYNDDYCGVQSQLDFSYLSAGTYYAKVYGWSTQFGSYVLNITGTQDDPFEVILAGLDVQCNGVCNGEISTTINNFTGIPPFTYLWLGGETTADLTGLCAGYYEVAVTDANNETVTNGITLIEPATLLVSLFGTDVTTIGGNNGAIDLYATGGVAPYTFLWSNNETTEDLTAIFGGYYTVTVTDDNGCGFVESILISAPLPPGWTPTITPDFHTINIPLNAVIDLDAIAIPHGSYIGVFYSAAGTEACGGVAIWSGATTQLIAFGNQVGMNNGFDIAETFSWKVWDISPAMYGEYTATATYSSMYPDQGQFAINGLSGLEELHALSIQTQIVELPNGWSLWSTYIDPTMPDIEDVLFNIVSQQQVIIVKNGYGNVYWPAWFLDNIGDLVIGEGYQIKTTTATQFDVSGLAVVPELTPIVVPDGWSLLGYLRQSPGDIAVMLAPMNINNNLVIAKDYLGNIYWPLYFLNNIGNMLPGDGYQVKLNGAFTLTYPQNSAPISSGSKSMINDPVYYDDVENTGNNMSLGIPVEAWTEIPNQGDEIGVFNPGGELIGSGVFNNEFTAITIWGYEVLNEKDITTGQTFTLKLWRNINGIEEEIEVNNWTQGNGLYEKDAISIVGAISISNSNDVYALYQNMPNPFKENTEIKFYLPVSDNVNITVYNTLGEKLVEVVSNNFEAGEHTVTFDANHLPSGNYFYKMVTDNFVSTKPMNINR